MMLGQIGLNSIMYLIICVGFLVKQQFKVNKNQRKWLISSTIAVILLQMVYIWTVLPSKSLLNYLSHNIIIGLIAVGVVYLAERNADVISSAKNHSSIKLALILVGSFVLLLGASFTYDIASKKHVYSTLTLVEGQDTPELDKDDTPVTIPPKTVRNKMKKSMNQFDNQQFYELGELQVQKIAGDVVYVAPLEFKGIWRWLKAGASEGYLKMSATDVYEQPVPVKREMTYIPSAYFFKDAARKIYFASARYKSMGVPQLEIDDNGKAYYVQTLYRPRGISENPNYKKMKIAVLDTETGKVTLYDLKDVPKFIDAPISPEMASEMNSVYGKYEEGWLNSQLAKKGVKLATTNGTEDEVTPIFNEKGEMLYFTDFTSPSNSDDSAIGYSYINARTGELTYYSKKNMMDSEGLLSLVNLVYPEKKLVGNMPLLYNIDGVPTWVVSMLDKNGIFKKIAYVNATDTDILAMEDTVDKALQVYRLKLGEKRSNVTATSKVTDKEISGQIVRLTSPIETSDGVIIKFVLDDNRIYTASEADNPLALFLQMTDKVHFSAKLVDDEVQGYITNLSIEGFDIQ
ncbi:DNA-binding protein [Vagococcus lutrae]|uniref:DNA-binding protein n=1 Tax=Vagococcus lutrae TaxID=81947 RepID=UPI00200D9C81|nr:DNA-binding protein [Vagococcus lutrae]UQF23333.1 DNA-binding protein [Vagococcus lutrae]UQF64583.1 DNA-binding protein [Vagococcus lutrae]